MPLHLQRLHRAFCVRHPNFSFEIMPLLLRKTNMGILVLAALILLPLLLVTGLQTAQHLLHISREERFAADRTVTLTLDAASVVWEEEGRELRVGERYFDVASIEKQGSKLLLRGHYDDVETAVWQLLRRAVQHNKTSGIHLLFLLQCFVPVILLSYLFRCRALLPCWQRLRQHTLPLPFLFPPFCPPRKA